MRIVFALVITVSVLRIGAPESYRFDFGPGKVAATYIQALPEMEYTEPRGYGFDLGSQGIRQNKLELSKWLANDVTPFDPAIPDSVADFHLPPSPQTDDTRPDGN
jgi:hypothetical protein